MTLAGFSRIFITFLFHKLKLCLQTGVLHKLDQGTGANKDASVSDAQFSCDSAIDSGQESICCKKQTTSEGTQIKNKIEIILCSYDTF